MGSQILQQLINGLSLGCVYGLISIGYSMVYGILEMLNFAHGDVFMIGGFIGYGILRIFQHGNTLSAPAGLVLVLMIVAAMLGCGVLGMGIEFLAYRPLRKAPRLAPLISALAMSIFLENFVALTLGARAKNYSTELLIPINWQVNFWGVQLSFVRILLIVVSIALMFGLDLYVRRTRFGKAMRATNNDRDGAPFMGISVNMIISVTFLIGSMLAGAAGVLVGLYYTQIDFFMGFTAGFKAFTAAVLGGIGNLRGAMLGGVVLGVAESLGIAFISPTYKDAIALVLLILLLLIKPSGLLGEQLPFKV
jgi:branched-chain amino acid transport system permease protein